mgnify:CR=1 FL=1
MIQFNNILLQLQLTPEEAERRKVRRERNKLAAAKCRQRRVDLTNRLITVSSYTSGIEIQCIYTCTLMVTFLILTSQSVEIISNYVHVVILT